MSHDIGRVVAWALDHPWALTRPMVSVVAAALARRMQRAEGELPLAGTERALDVSRPAPSAAPSTPGAVAVLPIHGVLAPRMNLLSDISGGATFEEASAVLGQLAADPNVATIVIDWDSPGGSVAGATEFAAAMLRARESKRLISVANHTMCSAAYWAGACATEVVASPSAMVGSIGVYCMHEDLSGYLAEQGIKITYTYAGRYKVDGNPTEPLSETAAARLQAVVDAAYAQFTADVAAGRGVSLEAVRAGFGEGAALTADEALRAGLIDRIETLDATVARAASLPPVPSTRPSARALAADDLAIGRELAALGLV